MYHYVRDLANSRYPGIKGCDVNEFREQIQYIKKNYNPVTVEEVIEASKNGSQLPEHAILLTFDDGYADHFNYVLPILYHEHIQGAFYAPVKAITEHTVLDVNKIHFILAATPKDKMNDLIGRLQTYVNRYKKEYQLDSFDNYYKQYAQSNRFDTSEVIFVKRMLQVALPEDLRKHISSEIFEDVIGMDEAMFSRELYMTMDQIKCMVDSGMHIGSHGFDHYWLGSLTREKQENEIEKSVEFINSIGADVNNWTICYPYGSYNSDTISVLKQHGCRMGFTCEQKVADLSLYSSDSLYKVPRLDVNDLPKKSDAQVNEWYY